MTGFRMTLAFALGCAVPLAATTAMQPASDGAPADFIIFFDWAKPDINRDAAEILDKAAVKYAAQPGARLILAGHSDRSGPYGVNLQSSRKRAKAARDYLEAHGVPAGAMTIHAYGEQQPIVDTEDGVREVQNRRVEIRFVPAG
jgi:outer membrane protein OmpA-like peptidoglycan-associated protein